MRMLTDGEVIDPLDARASDLEDENRTLKQALSRANADIERERRANAVVVRELRRQLTPLYQALQALFGELDAIPDSGAGTAAAPRNQAVWDAWKKRLGGKPSELIDALLLHGDMDSSQIAIAIQCHRNSVPQIVYKLNKAGLLNKNGGRFSLKPL